MAIIQTAFKFIKFDRAKSIGVTIGIIISTFLIGQQIGIFSGLTAFMSSTIDNTDAQIWVVDSRAKDVNQLGRFDIRTLYQVKSIQGIKEAYPVVIASGAATFKDGTTGNLLIIGSDVPRFIAGPKPDKIVAGKQTDLQLDGAISADFFDAATLGGTTNVGTEFELNGKKSIIAVQTKGIRGFGGTIAYSTIDRARFFGNVPSSKINAIVINVNNPEDIDLIISKINGTLNGVRAWKTSKFKSSTITTILSSSGIATSTGTLIVFALISGFFIIGLTMYSSALDRLRDYGTLKAIGASNAYITKLILTQAVSFSVVGFIIGFILLELFRRGIANSGLIFSFTPLMILIIFVVILGISIGGAAFALKRIKGIEPASVFR
jgi:putative ABC transport system permease protein